jgi:hypothetical protein
MLSEWMIEKPEDFTDNWYIVPCPKGIRTLVISHKVSCTLQLENSNTMLSPKPTVWVLA